MRDLNGKGVLTGLTNISKITASKEIDGRNVSCDGELWYRGYKVEELIYGMGHAVYSLSDSREQVFRYYVEHLAKVKGREDDLLLYQNVERIAPQLITQKCKIFKGVSPNVDFYSGFVYEMLGIPQELYTAIFAIARVVGWSAHRIEELVCTDKIIRPAYLSVMKEREHG